MTTKGMPSSWSTWARTSPAVESDRMKPSTRPDDGGRAELVGPALLVGEDQDPTVVTRGGRDQRVQQPDGERVGDVELLANHVEPDQAGAL